MLLKRLNAIATGIFAIAIGSALLTFFAQPFTEELLKAQRQREVVATIVGQQAEKVCKPRPHTSFRTRWRECKDWMTVQCPIVQYQPETGGPLKFTECSLRSLLIPETQLYVIYDSTDPVQARVVLEKGTTYHWTPVFVSAMPLGLAGLCLITGFSKLRQGLQKPD